MYKVIFKKEQIDYSPGNSQKNYSPGMIAPKCFTPVIHHNLASFLMLPNTDVGKDAKL